MKKRKLIGFLLILVVLIVLLNILMKWFYRVNPEKYTVSNITDINEAYNVKNCVNKYYEYCKNYIDTNEKLLFNLIDNDYIKYYNLNQNNFKKNIEFVESDRIKINNVYKIASKKNISVYLVKYSELYNSERDSKEFNILLKIDSKENIFSIYPSDYIDDNQYLDLKIGDKVSFLINGIELNNNNEFDYSDVSIRDNINDIFNDYKNLCTFYYKDSYKVINENCKNSKFEKFEIYDKYLTDNFKNIVFMKLVSYQDNQKDGYIEYTCADNYGKKYIFNVYSYITYDVIIEDN